MTIRLGLIGDNIKPSRAPELHRKAGRLTGVKVEYDLLIPPEMGLDFDGVFDKARAEGMRGLNITYPYKQTVVSRVHAASDHLKRLGALNTIIFENGKIYGYNTDYSGFIAAYRARFGDQNPGPTMIVGAGGAGRAVAFGLAELGASELVIVDADLAKAHELAQDLMLTRVTTLQKVDERTRDMHGIVNCTPVGMIGYPGIPVDQALLGGQFWGFEAVYTPRETEFLRAATGAGIEMIGGYELFVHQGIDAFRLFTGKSVGEAELRAALDDGQGR